MDGLNEEAKTAL